MDQLKPKVGLRSASFLVVAVIIGSGVFKKIAPMSDALGSPWWVILCWIIAGIISLAGALSTAELVSMFPNSGGEYFYFQKIYGKFFAYIYGWSSFTIVKTAAISALAYIFAQSLDSMLHFPAWGNSSAFLGIRLFENLSVKLVASVLIIVLTYLNYRGLHFAEKLSGYLTYLLLAGILLFIIFGLSSSKGDSAHFNTQHGNPLSGMDLFKAMFLASLGAFWGYEGWNNIAYIGEEIKDPKRNLPLALMTGTLIVIAAYVLLNIVYLYVQPIDFFVQLSTTPNKIAAVEVAATLGGTVGMSLVACLILVSTLNATNSSIMMSGRMVYAMSRDQLFFKKASSVHPKYNTPDWALFIQGFWAIALLFSGSFDQLTDMLIFAAFFFYGSSALGVIIMRIKHPELERNYKVPAYPILPILFCVFCAVLFINTIIAKPGEAVWGLLLMGSGAPFYWWFKRKKS